ncbi:MAG: glycosyltransferase family 1 protein [Acidobacteriota bacterium]
MRVALDATPLTLTSGGLRRYTAELSCALAAEFPGDDFVLVSDQLFDLPPAAACLPNLRRGPGPRNLLERRWWLWGVARVRAQVFHGTDFAVPYLPLAPSVLTLHDLSPWLDPGWHHAAGRVRRRAPFLIRLGLATMIVTHCEAVRRAAIERFRLHPGRIVAVPLAASSVFRPVESPPQAAPYFLFAGTLEPRKNLPLLVEAWRAVRKLHQVDLVLAGRRRADFPPLAEQAGLRVLGEAPDEQLPVLYSGALACVYPSLYEGFGLPVLEAMQCGAAVITSRDPAITEVAAGAAVQLDARDTRAWVEALTAATNPEWAAAWRARSLARARQFSWSRTARLTREVYDEARRQFRS